MNPPPRFPSRARLLWLACLVACGFHLWLFTSGYRMSADDVVFVGTYMDGNAAMAAAAEGDARRQGRIGMYLARPLNSIAAYHAGSLPFRLFCVVLYFGIFLLLADFLSRLVRSDARLAFFIALVAMNPLAFEHMPPAAYPLQNTLPLVLMLACRVAMMALTPAMRPSVRLGVRATATVVLLLCMLESEYAVVFGVSLLLVEYGMRMLGPAHERRPPGVVTVLWDAAPVVLALATYLVFRALNPSQYAGNSLDGLANAGRFAETVVSRLATGTIFEQSRMMALSLPWHVVGIAALVGLLSGLVFHHSLGRVQLHRAGLLCVLCMAAALLVITPVSASAKYQAWCLDSNACGFLDSRIAYLWLVAAAVALLFFVQGRLPRKWRRGSLWLASVCLALVSGYTFAYNWRQSLSMAEITSAWDRARAIACLPERIPASDAELARLIDPDHLIAFHSTVEPGAYWRKYVVWGGRHFGCPTRHDLRVLEYTETLGRSYRIGIGDEVDLSVPGNTRYLVRGWAPESWGAWSIGTAAVVGIAPEGSGPMELEMKLVRHDPRGNAGPVSIRFDGVAVAELQVVPEPREYRVLLPPTAGRTPAEGFHALEFHIADPVSPRQAGTGDDPRELGVGLVKFRLSKIDGSPERP